MSSRWLASFHGACSPSPSVNTSFASILSPMLPHAQHAGPIRRFNPRPIPFPASRSRIGDSSVLPWVALSGGGAMDTIVDSASEQSKASKAPNGGRYYGFQILLSNEFVG